MREKRVSKWRGAVCESPNCMGPEAVKGAQTCVVPDRTKQKKNCSTDVFRIIKRMKCDEQLYYYHYYYFVDAGG